MHAFPTLPTHMPTNHAYTQVASVQLQLLTATVKLFLKRPNEAAQKMISLVLSCATNDTDNPDLRDRAYIYWRLLSTDPEVRRGTCRGDGDALMQVTWNPKPSGIPFTT